MEHIYALLMTLLEMLFLFVVLAVLCHQRTRLGKSAFTMSCVLILVFNRLLVAADLKVALWGSKTFLLGEVALYLPVLTAFLMVYILFGVLNTQRILIGIVVSFLLSVYFVYVTVLQCSWRGFFLFSGGSGQLFAELLAGGNPAVNALAASHLLEMLLIPLFYSRVISWRFPRRVAVPAALFGAQLTGLLPFFAVAAARNSFDDVLNGTFYARMIATVILSFLLLCYLELLESEVSQPQTGALDFIFAFFGSYGKVQELQRDLKEWENRFHMILQHSVDAIVVTDETGKILEANGAASRLFTGKNSTSLAGISLFSLFEMTGNKNKPWCEALETPLFFQGKIGKKEENERFFTASLAPIPLRKQRLLVLIARDVTEEIRLASEKALLTEQLNHAQRLESLGMLAGGVAHDFNNYIHAILGHVDVASLMERNDPEAVQKHIDTIGSIAEKAGKLTGQLLGFARKGKYHVVSLDVASLFEACRELLGPGKMGGIPLTIRIPKGEWLVAADAQQMHQVLLNLMLNAVYAMEHDPAGENKEKELVLAVGEARECPLPPVPPPERSGCQVEDYLFLSVSDNGCGMDEMAQKRLFEPFFTTKPIGVGTGMGLAMTYGIITHHNGWIQWESTPGKGTVFYLFLPRAKENETK